MLDCLYNFPSGFFGMTESALSFLDLNASLSYPTLSHPLFKYFYSSSTSSCSSAIRNQAAVEQSAATDTHAPPPLYFLMRQCAAPPACERQRCVSAHRHAHLCPCEGLAQAPQPLLCPSTPRPSCTHVSFTRAHSAGHESSETSCPLSHPTSRI